MKYVSGIIRKGVGVVLLGWSCATPKGFSEETLSLPEAVSEAVEHNFDLAAARLRAVFPEIQVQIEKSDFRWRVRPSFALERSSEHLVLTRLAGTASKEFSSGALFQTRAEWTTREEGRDSESVEVRVEQPLFRRFGELAALRNVDAATHRLHMARWNLQRETGMLMMRVVRAFTSALNQERRVEREALALARADDLVRMVQMKRRQGRATVVDVLEMKTLHQEAELRLRRAEEHLIRTRAELAELLGRVAEQVPELEPVALDPWEGVPAAESEKLAREHRVERMQALASYEDARRQLKLERRELYPDISLVGSWEPVAVENEGNWFFGLSGGGTLDRHVTELEVEQQEARVHAALMEVASVELQLSREVREALSRLRMVEEELRLADTRTELASKRLRMTRGLYPGGRTSALQLREAEEEWVEAEAELDELRLERVRARYGYWHALGLLVGGAPEEGTEGIPPRPTEEGSLPVSVSEE